MGNALTTAKSQIGNTDGTKYWKYVVGSAFVSNRITPWCACFVTWCFNQAGVLDSIKGVPNKAYCPSFVNWAKANGHWKKTPQVGALVLYDWNHDGVADHIGIVEKVIDSTHLQTVEGNTSNQSYSYGGGVFRRTRSTADVLGYVVVKYKTEGKTSSTASKITTPVSNGKIDVDGYFGAATVRATQKVLKTTIDGTVSSQPYANKKYLPNAVTGVWLFMRSGYKGGSQMVTAMQKLVGAKQDGYCGQETVKAMQRFLKVSVDGYMGPATVKAWQKYINDKI